MTLQELEDEIVLTLTGGVLELEIETETLNRIVQRSLREIERFWDETSFVTVPFASCIDLNDSALDLNEKVSSVLGVYRSEAYGNVEGSSVMTDPMYMQQWLIFSNGGTMYNLNDYVMNYTSYLTLMQMKSNMSTDMSFSVDKHNNKLYINNALSNPRFVTIEYVPKLSKVEDVKDEFWVDYLFKISLALTKQVLGRIRTRFTQSNAIYAQDGEKLLEEGNTEYKELIDELTKVGNIVAMRD